VEQVWVRGRRDQPAGSLPSSQRGFAFYWRGMVGLFSLCGACVDVVFPKNTPMEIRFGTHDGSAPAHSATTCFRKL